MKINFGYKLLFSGEFNSMFIFGKYYNFSVCGFRLQSIEKRRKSMLTISSTHRRPAELFSVGRCIYSRRSKPILWWEECGSGARDILAVFQLYRNSRKKFSLNRKYDFMIICFQISEWTSLRVESSECMFLLVDCSDSESAYCWAPIGFLLMFCVPFVGRISLWYSLTLL